MMQRIAKITGKVEEKRYLRYTTYGVFEINFLNIYEQFKEGIVYEKGAYHRGWSCRPYRCL